MPKSKPPTGSAPVAGVSGETPTSSPGEASLVVTPKDVDPDNATARDLIIRDIRSNDIDKREEALLDDAIELSFPASDPIAVPPCRDMHEQSEASKKGAQAAAKIPKSEPK